MIKFIFKTLMLSLVLLVFLILVSRIYVWSDEYFEQQYLDSKKSSHIQEVYDRLVKASGQEAPDLLILRNDKKVNASCSSDRIRLYGGMIDFVKNDDELALVLAHEISHYQLKHVFQDNPMNNSFEENIIWDLQKEENADKLGGFMMMQAGYDVCKGRKMWLRLKEQEGDVLENLGHPTDIFRYVNLNMPWCGDEL